MTPILYMIINLALLIRSIFMPKETHEQRVEREIVELTFFVSLILTAVVVKGF
jgi:hypothetical protein